LKTVKTVDRLVSDGHPDGAQAANDNYAVMVLWGGRYATASSFVDLVLTIAIMTICFVVIYPLTFLV
jgi:hypothetical protein